MQQLPEVFFFDMQISPNRKKTDLPFSNRRLPVLLPLPLLPRLILLLLLLI
jgi:hypothetical protein